MTPVLPLGTKVKGYGKVSGVCNTGGERHYWLTTRSGSVAFLPAGVVVGMLSGVSRSSMESIEWTMREYAPVLKRLADK